MAYDDPVFTSGQHVGAGEVSFEFSQVNANSISALKGILVDAGWTNIEPGIAAKGGLLAIAIPFHDPSFGDNNAVPINAAGMGYFDGTDYRLYDPFWTGHHDPTGDMDDNGVIITGVPLGSTVDGTLSNFAALVGGASRWGFSFDSVDPSTNIALGHVEAKVPGPGGNIDSFAGHFVWEPDSSNLASNPAPTRGGYVLKSQHAPVTNDQLTITIIQGEFQNMRVRTDLNGTACPEYPLSSKKYMVTANPYQFSAISLSGQPLDISDISHVIGGGEYQLSAALHVPTEYGPRTLTIDSVVNNLVAPVVVHTDDPHGLEEGERIKISGAVGATTLNAGWFVGPVITDHSFWLSPDGSATRQGDGAVYTGGGIITFGIWESMVNSATMSNSLFSVNNVKNDSDPINTVGQNNILVNGVFKQNWLSPDGAVEGVALHVANIGTTGPALTSGGKPVIHEPWVAVRIEDNKEARIAGHLWNCFIGLKREAPEAKVSFRTKEHVVWLSDAATLPLIHASLWMQLESD